MADYTSYPNGEPIKRAGGANAASLPGFSVYENTLNFAERNLAIGDTVSEFLTIPSGSMVMGVMVEVIVADANAATLDVGDVTDPNGYAAAVALNTAAKSAGAGAYLDTAGAKPTPVFYADATDLSLTIGGANANTGTVRVAVMVANGG